MAYERIRNRCTAQVAALAVDTFGRCMSGFRDRASERQDQCACDCAAFTTATVASRISHVRSSLSHDL